MVMIFKISCDKIQDAYLFKVVELMIGNFSILLIWLH